MRVELPEAGRRRFMKVIAGIPPTALKGYGEKDFWAKFGPRADAILETTRAALLSTDSLGPVQEGSCPSSRLRHPARRRTASALHASCCHTGLTSMVAALAIG